MKQNTKAVVAALALAIGSGFWAPVVKAEAMHGGMNHEEKAQAYETKAGELDTVITEHQQMKKAGMTDKTSQATRAKMEKHCDAIIKDAAKLRDDYKAFAQHHRMMATESKGQ